MIRSKRDITDGMTCRVLHRGVFQHYGIVTNGTVVVELTEDEYRRIEPHAPRQRAWWATHNLPAERRRFDFRANHWKLSNQSETARAG